MLHAEPTVSRMNGCYYHNRDSNFVKPEEDAFVAVYETHFPKLVAFFTRRCSPEESEDLAAATLNNAYLHWHQVKNPDHVAPWLFAIARNLLSNRFRDGNRRKRKADLVSLDEAKVNEESPWDNPEKTLIIRELCGEVLGFIEEGMPPRMRQCLIMNVKFGYSYEKIARRLKIEVGTVKSQISQARQKLHEHLGPLGLDLG